MPELADNFGGGKDGEDDSQADQDSGVLQESIGSLKRLHPLPALARLHLTEAQLGQAIIHRGR